MTADLGYRVQDDEESEPQMSEDLKLVGKDKELDVQRSPAKQWPADECATTLRIPKVPRLLPSEQPSNSGFMEQQQLESSNIGVVCRSP